MPPERAPWQQRNCSRLLVHYVSIELYENLVRDTYKYIVYYSELTIYGYSATTLVVYVSHLRRLEHQNIKVGKFTTYAYTTVSSPKLTSDEIKILILGMCSSDYTVVQFQALRYRCFN